MRLLLKLTVRSVMAGPPSLLQRCISSLLPASNRDMGKLTQPSINTNIPNTNFSFNPYLSGLPGASTTWRSSWVDKESLLTVLKVEVAPTAEEA